MCLVILFKWCFPRLFISITILALFPSGRFCRGTVCPWALASRPLSTRWMCFPEHRQQLFHASLLKGERDQMSFSSFHEKNGFNLFFLNFERKKDDDVFKTKWMVFFLLTERVWKSLPAVRWHIIDAENGGVSHLVGYSHMLFVKTETQSADVLSVRPNMLWVCVSLPVIRGERALNRGGN